MYKHFKMFVHSLLLLIFLLKLLTKSYWLGIIIHVKISGRLAQLGEHLPYKQGVTGSSPVVPTIYFVYGLVVQLVRTLACHARGRGFEPHSGRQNYRSDSSVGRAGDWKSPCRGFDSLSDHQFFAGIAQLIERCLAKAEVAGLSPVSRSILYIFVIKKYIFNIIY